MAHEFENLDLQTDGSEVLALFGALYPVHRAIGTGGLPWPAHLIGFSADAYATATEKLGAAQATGLGVALTTIEQASLAIALMAKNAYVRHGGALPWVPDREYDVNEAKKTQGAGKIAMPDAKLGTVTLDPFGFVPQSFGATDRTLLRATREALRIMGRANTTPLPAGTFVDLPTVNVGGGEKLGIGPGGIAIIVVGVVGVLGYGIYKWADVAEKDNEAKWYYTSGTAAKLGLANVASTMQASRYALAGEGKPVPPPSELEIAMAKGIESSGSEPSKWTGPLLAVGFIGLSAGALLLARSWMKKDGSLSKAA